MGAISAQRGRVVDEALRKLLYSRPVDPVTGGLSIDEVEANIRSRGLGFALDSGVLKVVQSTLDIDAPAFRSGRNSDIWGYYVVDANGKGTSYLIAENLSLATYAENTPYGVALHELGVHHGMEDILGSGPVMA